MRNSNNNRDHQTTKLHIKKGDTVRVLSGNDRKKEGLVLKVYPQTYRAVVEGVHVVSKHKKPTAKTPQGSIVKMEAPIHVSNIILVDPVTKKPTRIGRKTNSEGKLQRYSKTTGEFI